MIKTLLWLVPYLVSGFSAPFIFKNSPTPQMGGHIAGALFVFAGIWSVFLSFKFQMPKSMKLVFTFVLILQIVFWIWRFFNDRPLKEAVLLGMSGSLWHGALTACYLSVAVAILGWGVSQQLTRP